MMARRKKPCSVRDSQAKAIKGRIRDNDDANELYEVMSEAGDGAWLEVVASAAMMLTAHACASMDMPRESFVRMAELAWDSIPDELREALLLAAGPVQ